MLWLDMLCFWIIAYGVWNFVYTYNCIPMHSWYAGLALLLAPTLYAFSLGKGVWLHIVPQHLRFGVCLRKHSHYFRIQVNIWLRRFIIQLSIRFLGYYHCQLI